MTEESQGWGVQGPCGPAGGGASFARVAGLLHPAGTQLGWQVVTLVRLLPVGHLGGFWGTWLCRCMKPLPLGTELPTLCHAEVQVYKPAKQRFFSET